MPRHPKIQYTGVGSHISGLHTKTEFLRIMRNQFPDKIHHRFLGDAAGFVAPGKIKKDDIAGWMKFANAKY